MGHKMKNSFGKGKGVQKKRLFKRKDRKGKLKQSVQSVIAQYADFSKEDASKLNSFALFPLSDATKRGLEENNFIKPTEIQRESLQYSLSGVDVVGAAKTGSGKTLALLIPVLECLWRQHWSRSVDGLGAVIISPTRELAFQTFNVLNRIGAYHDFSAALLIGGTDVEYERNRIGGVNILVCTPGRLLQHMDENSTFSCDQLQILVIDEADRILDLGFSRQMSAIMENLPVERQTLLFSATQTKNVDDLIRLALRNPLYISVHENAPQATPESLRQSYFVCKDDEKINMLWSFLLNHRKKKTLIFVSCCKQARFLTEAFCHMRPGLSLVGLWGTMNQMKRLEVFKKFNNKVTGTAMIATDVASRGLDFARVDWVVQLDCPADVDDYIHRVGRTARMDAEGEAVLVLTPSQEAGMVKCLHNRNIPISKTSIDSSSMFDISKRMQSTVAQYPNMKEFAQRSFVAYIRSIYLMRNKDIFDVQSIDFAALARSYGLASAPRVRFLKRAMHKQNTSIVRPTQEKMRAEELLKMLSSPSKNISTSHTEAVAENDHMKSGKYLDKGNEMLKSYRSKENMEEVSPNIFNSDEGGFVEGDDFLKLVRKDVFDVQADASSVDADTSTEPKRTKKPLTKITLARKFLKKGLKMNVKKVFMEDGSEIIEGGSFVRKGDESAEFSLDEAKQEMEKIDAIDKEAYKQKQKKWRKLKKEKLKKLRAQKSLEGEGGAILDLADGENIDETPDLSWLPDPDKPKKFDREWNEIEVTSKAEEESETNSRNVTDSKKAKKIHKWKMLREDEEKAMSLLRQF